jgi:Fe-S cluster assembly ATPase SufC
VDRIHVMVAGRIVESGDAGLAEELETTGYDALAQKYGQTDKPVASGSFIDGL